MAKVSVLGKRKATEHLPSSIVTRKRRALNATENDENADPDILPDADDKEHSSDIDELAGSYTHSKRSSRIKAAPAKHDASRVALSLTKANGQKKSLQSSKPLEKEEFTAPSRPRAKNFFAEFAKPTTPASTPKSRVQAAAKAPSTPRTPGTPRSSNNVYNCARQLFTKSTSSGQLIGREKERAKITKFVQDGLDLKSGRCLYVSGPPGTGKSAFVGEVCKQFSANDDAQVAYINCMSINSAREIYDRLAAEVYGEVPAGSGAAAAALRKTFFPGEEAQKVYIVTLDEIDHLLSFDLSCLYNVFEWALNLSSNLVLIGIANALDFTDRFLPRLKARSLKPELLPFPPYTVPEIDSVITTRLRSLLSPDSLSTADTPFLRPEAIKLLARKVAAQTGDLRKAFDIVRRTIDLMEAESKASGPAPPPTPPLSSPLSENSNLSSPSKPNNSSPSHKPTPPSTPQKQALNGLEPHTPSSAPRATPSHIARATSSLFGTPTSQRLKSLTLQQKAALCSLLSLEKQTTARLKDLALGTPSKSTFSKAALGIEVRKAWEAYVGLVKKRDVGLALLTRGEFGEVISGMVEGGLVREVGVGLNGIGGRGRGGMKGKGWMGCGEMRVEAAVTEGEVRGSLEGVGGEMVRGLLLGEE